MHLGFHPYCFIVLVIQYKSEAVDRGNFKTCSQSAFCKLHRGLKEDSSVYNVIPDSVTVHSSWLRMHVESYSGCGLLKVDVFALEDNTVRLKVSELKTVKQRYEIPVGDVLVQEPKQQRLEVTERDDSKIVMKFEDSTLVVKFRPFSVSVLRRGKLVVSVNSKGLLKYQLLRSQQNQGIFGSFFRWLANPFREEAESDLTEIPSRNDLPLEEDYLPGEETFKTFKDSKPNGPASVGVDVSFHDFNFVYGIPEHADNLALKFTKGHSDPYRLYNLDVFQYELYNPMALYGSVPVMLAHNAEMTVGMLWLNAAETWVDIDRGTTTDEESSDSFAAAGEARIGRHLTRTHWFSESGIIDLFLMLGGNSPADVFRQYATLTGVTPLPPLFALGYHQSRWNYVDENDVRNVEAGFEEHNIPMDVIWLDIEHTDGKRYFTWDKYKFAHAEEMIRNISARGRRMVSIVDPHLRRDSNYFVYAEGRDNGYLVTDKDGAEYEGWCWPGSSAWLDYVNPEVRQFWASKFSLSEYKGSTINLYTWNDMNEPSVFNGPEITMHKDALHHDGYEHRDVHNIYGTYVHRATIEGQLERSANQSRPFVLSRAFFAGSQRYGAVWTGDNTADWGHLKISIPMVLTLNLVGLTLSGADIGGFFSNPDHELLTRWYQAGAYQPFYRAHAHLDTRRREPWLLPAPYSSAIRESLRQRYRLLPYWYTLFYEAERAGGPVIRPLWVEYPTVEDTFDVDDEYMLGGGMLIHPVTERGATYVTVYLPDSNEIYYDYDTHEMFRGGQRYNVSVDINKVPVFLRGGYILPLRERIRRSSDLVPNDPYSLLVVLDQTGNSTGRLYHDDFKTFQYQRRNDFILQEFNFTRGSTLSSRNLNVANSFKTNAWLERITIVGLNTAPRRIQMTLSSGHAAVVQLEFKYNADTRTLVIRKPAVNISTDFTLTLD